MFESNGGGFSVAGNIGVLRASHEGDPLLGSYRGWDGIINRKNHEKHSPILFCSIWQLVKNWLSQNDGNHILHKYTPRISNIPSDNMSKSWKFMKLDITMILHIFFEILTPKSFLGKSQILSSLEQRLKVIYNTHIKRTALTSQCRSKLICNTNLKNVEVSGGSAPAPPFLSA